MGIFWRCVALCSLAVVLTACSSDAADLSPEEVCGLVTLDEARGLLKDITDDRITAAEESRSGDLPACRYGSGDGKPYLLVAIHETSRVDSDNEGDKVTVAGQEAVQVRPDDHSCSVFVPLAEDRQYLLAIGESWDPDKETCGLARDALEKAYPRLSD